MSTNGAKNSGPPKSGPQKAGAVGPTQSPLHHEISREDTRRMAPVYVGAIIVQVLTLLAIWWFQEYFS